MKQWDIRAEVIRYMLNAFTPTLSTLSKIFLSLPLLVLIYVPALLCRVNITGGNSNVRTGKLSHSSSGMGRY